MQTDKQKAIAKDLLQLDAEDIYSAHMQCEGNDFLVSMIEEGIIRLSHELGDNKARLIVRGLTKDLLT